SPHAVKELSKYKSGERDESSSHGKLNQSLVRGLRPKQRNKCKKGQGNQANRGEVRQLHEYICANSNKTEKPRHIDRAWAASDIEKQDNRCRVERDIRNVGRHPPKKIKTESRIDVGQSEQEPNPGGRYRGRWAQSKATTQCANRDS